MTLKKFQQNFGEFFLSGEHDFALQKQLKAYPRDILEARLNIHRNNYYASLGDILRETFSTVNQLVGDTFFTALANNYLTQHPPTKAAMLWLGDTFPHFIARFEHTQKISYLADVARVNWAQHLAYHAKDTPPLTARNFADIDNDTLGQSAFIFHPSLALLQSPYALYSIWQYCLPTEEANVDEGSTILPSEIDADRPENILVARPSTTVATYNLSHEVAFFISQLLTGQTLLDAVSRTADYSDSHKLDFNASDAVSFLISSGIVTSTIIPEGDAL
ncbi:HvfC/BufC N-terminal domain-containing protein [Teredinibacter purpureus]|uniref:HvfC/BufC N-terminal domain-containing protein n=1 Tax=Teredinibacter purpureus TaxID=2731756 RepID=UPI0005F82B7E|nr:DNA-binding domain-containing protein [Teredinibacter purpureus]